jgi:hypothetical protein
MVPCSVLDGLEELVAQDVRLQTAKSTIWSLSVVVSRVP